MSLFLRFFGPKCRMRMIFAKVSYSLCNAVFGIWRPSLPVLFIQRQHGGSGCYHVIQMTWGDSNGGLNLCSVVRGEFWPHGHPLFFLLMFISLPFLIRMVIFVVIFVIYVTYLPRAANIWSGSTQLFNLLLCQVYMVIWSWKWDLIGYCLATNSYLLTYIPSP